MARHYKETGRELALYLFLGIGKTDDFSGDFSSLFSWSYSISFLQHLAWPHHYSKIPILIKHLFLHLLGRRNMKDLKILGRTNMKDLKMKTKLTVKIINSNNSNLES